METTARTAALDVAALPLQVAKRVFAYAIDSRWGRHTYSTEFLPRTCTRVDASQPALLLVSKAWTLMLAHLADEFSALVHHFRIRIGQTDELQALYRVLEEATRGSKICDLRVCVGTFGWDHQFALERAFASTSVVDALAVDWHRVFAACPRLVRLDLACLPLNCTRQLAQILDAASTHCPDLQALVLPLPHQGFVDSASLARTMAALYEALERWFTRGAGGGLVQLTVPRRVPHTSPDALALNDQFFDAVVQWCPNVQYLDGWKATYYDDSNLFCGDRWLASLQVWTRFCATCVRLREFNWIVAPFHEPYLVAFAAHRKPVLQKMTLVCGNERYGESAGGGDAQDSDNSDSSTREWTFAKHTVAQILAACPALQELHLLFYGPSKLSRRLHASIDDAFFETLARQCPLLAKLVVYEMQTTRTLAPLKHVSDAGLDALARMPRLDHIALKQTQCSARGILALVLETPTPERKRRVVLKVGSTVRPAVCFFRVLLELLELLALEPREALAHRRFELKLCVSSHASRLADPAETRTRIVASANRVLQAHSTLAVVFQTKYAACDGVPTDLRKLASVVILAPRTMAVSDDSEFATEWTGEPR